MDLHIIDNKFCKLASLFFTKVRSASPQMLKKNIFPKIYLN